MKFSDLHLDEGPVFSMLNRFMTKMRGDETSATTREYEAKKKELAFQYSQARKAKLEREAETAQKEKEATRTRELRDIAMGGKPKRRGQQPVPAQEPPPDNRIVNDVALGIYKSISKPPALDLIKSFVQMLYKPGMSEAELLRMAFPHFNQR